MRDTIQPSAPPSNPPPRDAIEAAGRQALARLRADHARLSRAECEDIVQAAHAYCAPKWDGVRPYAAFVATKAGKLAIDQARKETRAGAPVRATAERPQTLETLRDAVLTECRRRVRAATGEDFEPRFRAEDVRRERTNAREARALVAHARNVPGGEDRLDFRWWAQQCCETPPWHELVAAMGPRVGYLDAGGGYRRYGDANGERAVLSLLSGSWPKVSVGSVTVAEVIEAESAAIRTARRRVAAW